MSKIKDIVVLNTVTANGTDASVDSNGVLNILGTDAIKASRITNMVITPYVAETLQVTVITPTSANSTQYKFLVQGSNIQTGGTYSRTFTYTSSASASRLEIVNAFVTAINADPYINVVASQTGSGGSETLTLTAKTGYPSFGVIESDTNLSVSTTTPPVIGVGLGSTITATYSAENFPALANVVAAGQYTTVSITYEDIYAYGENNTLGNSYNDVLLFVREGVTNYADLLGTYGTLTGLNQGYAVTLSRPATTTAAITVTTGAITLAGGSVTFATLAAQSGDFVVVNTGTSFSTESVTKITGITGAAAGFGTQTVAASAEAFKFAAWRQLPL